MNFHRLRSAARLTGLSLLLLVLQAPDATLRAQERVARFNEYAGWSEATYDGYQRASRYITMRDGTRLAADVFRPTRGGALHTERLPVVWTHSRYQRASIVDGELGHALSRSEWLRTLSAHGYIIAAVDTRGGGASFGHQPGYFSPAETDDAYEITEWLAAQPWSSGNIGMYGRSYLGITQYFAASEKPPHLKAIFPEMAVADFYDFMWSGGAFRRDFTTNWSFLTYILDTSTPYATWYDYGRMGRVAPVDADPDGVLLAQALEEHRATRSMYDLLAYVPFRDSRDEVLGMQTHIERSPFWYRDAIEESDVAIYHLAGWWDMFPRDALLWYNNLDNPQKVVIGPWFHGQTHGLDVAAEHLRWYDRWLKGIDNGVMDEPAIHYWTIDAPEGTEWRATDTWPLPHERPTDFHFAAGRSGTVASANDGVLATSPPRAAAADAYTVDYMATSGRSNRWTNGYGGWAGYPDMTENDERGLTYTSEPLEADLEVTGHPIARLWIEATAEDGDFFVYLEDVDSDGVSHYVTEGNLRASHRKVVDAPFETFGLPWHRSFEEDVAPLPDAPVELVIDLHPVSKLFRAGHRIRVTITGADRDNSLTPALTPAPTVTLHRAPGMASRITLPVIPPRTTSEG